MMGRDMFNGANFIGTTDDSAMIHFPRKKMYFCFNHPRDPDARSRRQNVGSLKKLKSAASPRRNRNTTDKKLSTHSA
jgi:hypothetical protein